MDGKEGAKDGSDVKDGYLYLKRTWKDGDKLELEFPMEVRVLAADSRVREDIGKVALMRGPIVYCMEEADNGKGLHLCKLAAEPNPEASMTDKVGIPMVGITTDGLRMKAEEEGGLYHVYSKPVYEAVKLQWIPYFTWANRGEGEMQVFIRAEEE